MNLNATLVAQMVVFFILWWVVAKFIWPPLVKALDERAKKIADGLAAADKGKAELELANKRVEQALTEARNEGAQRIQDAEKRAQMSADEIKQNAQAEAARIIAQAKAEAEQQTVRARECCATRLPRWPSRVPSRFSSVKSMRRSTPICSINSRLSCNHGRTRNRCPSVRRGAVPRGEGRQSGCMV